MSDYREMFLNYTKGLDPAIVARIESDMLDDPPQPQPHYENHCWNCKAPIDDVTCMDAGLDDESGEPNGFECNDCGMSLYEFRRRNVNG